MTLVFESAVRRFDADGATLHAPTESALDRVGAVDFSLETVYAHARHYDALRPADRPDWVRLPLHRADGPELTDEYVAYADHDLRGEIVVHAGVADDGDTDPSGSDADGDGVEDPEYLPVEAFAETRLARRLRYWHPDYVPEEYPDYYDSPLDDRERPVRGVDADEFFGDLRGHVRAERDERLRERREELAGADPAALFAAGEAAVPALRHAGAGDDAHTFVVETDGIDGVDGGRAGRRFVPDTFDVHGGDYVSLVAPGDGAPDAFPLLARVEDVAGTRLELALDATPGGRGGADRGGGDGGRDRAAGGAGRSGTGDRGGPTHAGTSRAVRAYLSRVSTGYGAVKLLNPLPYERRLDAVDRLDGDPTFRSVLTGGRALTFTSPRVARSEDRDPELNQEQRSAVRHALLADTLFCVHGPPGTGKTRTLVEVVRRAVDAGETVLVCADSNQAVDNLLVGDGDDSDPDPGSLHAYGQHGTGEFRLARRNVRRSDRPLVRDRYGGTAGTGAPVVAATNGSAARIDRRFDLAVVDEATQATIASTAVPLSKADAAVLAGDHRQLPPFSRTDRPPGSAYGRSLFEHLYADGGVFEDVGIQLRSQYRMHRDVAYFPNRRFYDRSLRTAVDVPALPGWPPMLGYDIGGRSRLEGTSYANPDEARLVEHLVGRLLDGGGEGDGDGDAGGGGRR